MPAGPSGGAEKVVPYKAPDITIKNAEDIAVNQMGIVMVLGTGSGATRQVLGAFPGDAVAGVYAPDGASVLARI